MTEPLSQPTPNSAQASTAPPGEGQHRTDPLPYPDAAKDGRMEPDRESPPGTPAWVKVFAITAIVLVLVIAGLHLTGNVPSHMPGSSGAEHGMQAP